MKFDISKPCRMRNGWEVKNLYVNSSNVICGKFYNKFLKNWYLHNWSAKNGKSFHQKEFDLVHTEEINVSDHKTNVSGSN